MRRFAGRHPAGTFLVLAFGWAWACWLPVAGADLSDLAKAPPSFFAFALLGGLGPSLAGLALRLALPRSERPPLVGRPRPPNARHWLALALAPTTGALSLALAAACGLPVGLGDVAARLGIGVAWPAMAALGEEFGWRGLLLPLWLRRRGFWRAALASGLAWALWHLPADYIGLKQLGWWFLPQFLVVGIGNLGVLALAMAALHRRANADIRLALCFHASVTASAILLGNQAALSPAQSLAQAALGLACLAALGAPLVWLLLRGR